MRRESRQRARHDAGPGSGRARSAHLNGAHGDGHCDKCAGCARRGRRGAVLQCRGGEGWAQISFCFNWQARSKVGCGIAAPRPPPFGCQAIAFTYPAAAADPGARAGGWPARPGGHPPQRHPAGGTQAPVRAKAAAGRPRARRARTRRPPLRVPAGWCSTSGQRFFGRHACTHRHGARGGSSTAPPQWAGQLRPQLWGSAHQCAACRAVKTCGIETPSCRSSAAALLPPLPVQ
jgi:hypothetical protein